MSLGEHAGMYRASGMSISELNKYLQPSSSCFSNEAGSR